jgi:hypothetical protein
VKLLFGTKGYVKLHFETNGYVKLHFGTNGYVKLHVDTNGYVKLHFGTNGYVKLHCEMFRKAPQDGSTTLCTTENGRDGLKEGHPYLRVEITSD